MELRDSFSDLIGRINAHGIEDVDATVKEEIRTKNKARRSPEEILKSKQDKLKKAQKELAALARAVSKKERKERDTALYTAGACLLAAIEGRDPELRKYAREIWRRVSFAHAPIISDYRRACLVKTSFNFDGVNL